LPQSPPATGDFALPLYQFGSDPAFEKCLPDTLIEEGGYSNDAHDPGGMTMEGIIQREYDSWRRKSGLPTLGQEHQQGRRVRTIYHDEYWLPHCQLVPPGLNLSLFDTNVNNGVHCGMVSSRMAFGDRRLKQW
jgi:lysozyme family protein